jgi:hypothetical protein
MSIDEDRIISLKYEESKYKLQEHSQVKREISQT